MVNPFRCHGTTPVHSDCNGGPKDPHKWSYMTFGCQSFCYTAKSRDRAAAFRNATEGQQSNQQQRARTSNSTHNFRVTRAAYFTYFVIQQRALHHSAVRIIKLARSTISSRHYVLLSCRDIRKVQMSFSPFTATAEERRSILKTYELFIYGPII